jgi:predicted Zn-dependent protease
MNASLIASLRSQRDGPRDGALLRFSLGNALIAAGESAQAIDELRRALVFDSLYSAAWKVLGKALLDSGQLTGAADAWRHGIDAAAQRGDKQAEKEMAVFLRRLEKAAP